MNHCFVDGRARTSISHLQNGTGSQDRDGSWSGDEVVDGIYHIAFSDPRSHARKQVVQADESVFANGRGNGNCGRDGAAVAGLFGGQCCEYVECLECSLGTRSSYSLAASTSLTMSAGRRLCTSNGVGGKTVGGAMGGSLLCANGDFCR